MFVKDGKLVLEEIDCWYCKGEGCIECGDSGKVRENRQTHIALDVWQSLKFVIKHLLDEELLFETNGIGLGYFDLVNSVKPEDSELLNEVKELVYRPQVMYIIKPDYTVAEIHITVFKNGYKMTPVFPGKG